MRKYRNYQFIIEQYITNYLQKKIDEDFVNNKYCWPDFEIGIADNGMLFVVRYDKQLREELDEIVDFLNSEFESSEDFAKFE